MANETYYENVHDRHRERLRKKFFSTDGDILEPHELLELLLYNVYKRKNTNPIARELLKKFGTVYGVFEADAKALMSVPGVGEQAAAMIKLQAALLRRYNIDRISEQANIELTPRNAGKYILNYFYGYSYETVVMFALDSKFRVITPILVNKGTVDRVHVYLREVVKSAIDSQATYVILAHNHPNGTLVASANDLRLTLELAKALAFVNIRLLDHIIVCENEYISLAYEYDVFNLMKKRK